MASLKGIPQGVVDEIRERADIQAVVADHVRLKRSGANYSGLCPFHNEKTPSFTVHPGKRIFHCFGCGAGGDVFTFLMKIQNLSFPAALEKVASMVGVDLTPYKGQGSEIDFGRAYGLMSEAQGFFRKALSGAPAARQYLQSRGLTEATLKEFGIGFAPDDWRRMSDHLVAQKHSAEELVSFGLARKGKESGIYDYFRGRIIFPIEDESGRVIGFGGRVMGDGQPKYLNSPETPLYSKGRVLFNLHRAGPAAAAAGGVIVLVEGYMDVIGVVQAGFRNVVATLGTALTDTQIRKLAKVATRLVFAYDPDAAGVQATLRALPLLEKAGLQLTMLRLPDGIDPDEFVQQNGAEAMRERIENGQPVEDFVFEATRDRHPDWQTDEGRRTALRDMAGVFEMLPSVVSQQNFIQRVADCFGIGEELVRKSFAGGPGRQALELAAPPPPRLQVLSPLVQAERSLIYCLLSDIAQYRKIASTLAVSEFKDPYCRRVLQLLAGLEDESGGVASQLLTNCEDEELRRTITAELMARPAVVPESAGMMLGDCLREIKRHRLEARKKELLRLVSSGGAGDEALREFKQVTDELQSLPRNSEAPAGPVPRAR